MRRLDHRCKVDESLQDKKQKGCHSLAPRRITKARLCQKNIFSCFQNSWTCQSLSHCTGSASLLALGSLFVSYASSAMVSVRPKDFTSRERHRCVELDARMNPALSHTTMNVLCCTQDFLRSVQHGIVVLGVIDDFVYAHDHHRRNIDNPGNFGDCMKGESAS